VIAGGLSDPVLELLIGVVGFIVFVGLILGYLLTRQETDPKHRRLRMGVFVERDRGQSEQPWPDFDRTAELPSSVRDKESE